MNATPISDGTTAPAPASLAECILLIADPRVDRTRLHNLGDILVIVYIDVLNRFKCEVSKLLAELERSHSGRLIFRSDPTLNRERFAIIDAKTEKTIDQG